jgi:hypothetical protein
MEVRKTLDKYRARSVWHFTDKANLDAILGEGLFCYAELTRRGVKIPMPGGNDWSHDADKAKGIDEYVHLSFLFDHPMLYRAREEGRIQNPVRLEIALAVLDSSEVRYCAEVANKSGAEILTDAQAAQRIDFEILYTRADWKDPIVHARRKAAEKSQILVPRTVKTENIIKVYG